MLRRPTFDDSSWPQNQAGFRELDIAIPPRDVLRDQGAVSPFPVDRAGDLDVKLTPDAARRLGDHDGLFVLTLVTADPSQALRGDIHLTVTATPEAG